MSAALECRSETDSILTTATFDSRQLNRTVIAEFALAVLTTQMNALRRIRWAVTPMTTADHGDPDTGSRMCGRPRGL